MQSNSATKDKNKEIAQLKYAIHEFFIQYKYNFEWILKRVGNVKAQVESTRYLQHDSEYIGWNALYYAAHDSDYQAYEIMISHGVDFTIKDRSTSTILMSNLPFNSEFERGVKDSFVESTLQAHMTHNKLTNPCDVNGFSHFHIACMANAVDAVEYFLDNGISVHQSVNADINESCKDFAGYTPMHFAARFGALETVELLLNYEANLYVKDSKGMTPWHILLEKNLKILNGKASTASKSVRQTNEQIMEILLYHDPDDEVIKVIDDTGLTYLHVACSVQDVSTAEDFLEKVSNFNHCVSKESSFWPGFSALHFAAIFNVKTVKLLAERGANIEIEDAQGVTPLDLCFERYKAEEIHRIMSNSAVWNSIVFSDGQTKLLSFVSVLESIEHLNEFLVTSAINLNIYISVDSPRWPGFTALHVAVKVFPNKFYNDNATAEDMGFGVIKELLSRGCNINAQDVCGWTPLHLAFRLGKKNLVKMLLKFSSNLVNVVDENNLSHLHIACAMNETSAVEQLLRNGVDVDIVYKGTSALFSAQPDSTPLHFATANESAETVELLLKHGADIYAKDAKDMTPIHLSVAFRGLKDIGNILLSSPYLNDSVISDAGVSHLHVAIIHSSAPAVKKLLEHKADLHRTIIDVNKFDHYKSELNKWDVGMSPLHLAMRTRSKEIIKLLIERGADVLAKAPICEPPLYAFLDWHHSYEGCWEVFMSALKSDVAVQKRAQLDIGLTLLHVACFEVDSQTVENLLRNGADANAQIHSNSPIWPGNAPLHVLLLRGREKARGVEMNAILSRLLIENADPFLRNAKQRTPIMSASLRSDDDLLNKLYRVRLRLMLNKTKDFNVNPVDPQGISHFHVACAVSESATIRKYLERGAVDVNGPIDFLSEYLGGCTPLHLVARCRKNVVGAFAQLEAADLLLRHGANVLAEDSMGNTPLHDAARSDSNCEDLFERLIKSGADPNARNVTGQTPLECLLLRDTVSIAEIKFFLVYGCHFQSFNPVTDKGYLAMTLASIIPIAMYNLLFKVMTNSPNLMNVKNAGRTAIHNLVSLSGSQRISADSYVKLINLLEKGGCNVDDQDDLGRTALHVAAIFRNDKAVAGLLKSGADVNVTDKSGLTALSYLFEDCTRCKLEEDNGGEHTQYHHLKLFEEFVGHLKKMQYFELEVNRINGSLVNEAFKKFNFTDVMFNEHFQSEIEKARVTRIGSLSINLAEFLCETWAIVAYPKMSQVKRDIIDEFFIFNENIIFWHEFNELSAIFQLQYRKAVARSELIRHSESSLQALIKYRLPALCNWCILDFLKNSDLKIMIESIKV